METVLLVIHLLLALGLIGVILVQRSEGGLGSMGGGGGGMGGLMSARGAANLLTRTTAILATAFMITSLALALLAKGDRAPSSIVDEVPAAAQPAAPQEPAAPTR